MRRRALPMHPRSGLTLAFTLAMLTALMALALLLTRVVVAVQKQSRIHQHQLQAMYLAESGLERAVVRLKAQPSYKGEVWNVAENESLRMAAEVQITIATIDGQRALKVQSNYGAGVAQASAMKTLKLPTEKP